MAKFFNDLKKYNSLNNEWINALDWLLDDKRFSQDKGWDKGKKTSFTKKAKRLFKQENFSVFLVKDMPQNTAFEFEEFVQMTSDKVEGESFIRHIRNAIAHGNANLKNRKSELWIELTDLSSKKHLRKTAIMQFKADKIPTLHKIYSAIEKGVANDKNKSENTTKKKTKSNEK